MKGNINVLTQRSQIMIFLLLTIIGYYTTGIVQCEGTQYIKAQYKKRWSLAQEQCRDAGNHFLPDIGKTRSAELSVLQQMDTGEFIWINSVVVRRRGQTKPALQVSIHLTQAKVGSYIINNSGGTTTNKCESWDQITATGLVPLQWEDIPDLSMLMSPGVTYWLRNNTQTLQQGLDWKSEKQSWTCVGIMKISENEYDYRTDNCTHAHPYFCVNGIVRVAPTVQRLKNRLLEMECEEVDSGDDNDNSSSVDESKKQISEVKLEEEEEESNLGVILGPTLCVVALLACVLGSIAFVKRRKQHHYQKRLQRYTRRNESGLRTLVREAEMIPSVVAEGYDSRVPEAEGPQCSYEELENAEGHVPKDSYQGLSRLSGRTKSNTDPAVPSYDKWNDTGQETDLKTVKRQTSIRSTVMDIQEDYEQFAPIATEAQNRKESIIIAAAEPRRRAKKKFKNAVDSMITAPELPVKTGTKKRRADVGDSVKYETPAGLKGHRKKNKGLGRSRDNVSVLPRQGLNEDSNPTGLSVPPISAASTRATDVTLDDLDTYENQGNVKKWNIGNDTRQREHSQQHQLDNTGPLNIDNETDADGGYIDTYENYIYSCRAEAQGELTTAANVDGPANLEELDEYENFTPKPRHRKFEQVNLDDLDVYENFDDVKN